MSQISQSTNSVAIGYQSGQFSQGLNSIAIGTNSGNSSQGMYATSLGFYSGNYNQGNYSIAIGYYAGTTGLAANSIVINATGEELDNNIPNACIISPVRNVNGDLASQMFYNSITGEITWGTAVPSSLKYKTNIQEVNDETLSLLHQLKSVEFDYKNNGRHAYGLIAEEVEQQIPTLVLRHPQTNEIESVDYIQLVPLLLKAIQ